MIGVDFMDYKTSYLFLKNSAKLEKLIKNNASYKKILKQSQKLDKLVLVEMNYINNKRS